MKVLVLGGAGVFGARLARMLLADGWEVTVAGRSLDRARAFTEAHGGIPLALDREEDPTPHLNGCLAVVDAAGPFQFYGADPYRFARRVLEAGVHYLDLSDDAAFTQGIGALDDLALAHGVAALSGVSSVPALSSAAVTALAEGLAEIDLVDTAILPGNRAPRGRSVMRSILSQTGAPVRLWRGGRWTTSPGWSGARRYELEPGLTRRAAFIGAPDLALFPARYGARSVLFRAGLELRVMQDGLAALGWLRRRGLGPDPARLTPLLWRVASWLEGFGGDRGGMVVEVTGAPGDGARELRRWTLLAEEGDGPFIPAIPAVIALGKLAEGRLAPGARPALDVFTLAEAEAALSRLRVRFRRDAAPAPALFERALGPAFAGLPPEVRVLHAVRDREVFTGRASVARGKSPLARIVAWAFRFPPEAADTPVTVTMTRDGTGEGWERNFGGRRFRSHLSDAGPGRFRERFGPFRFELSLPVAGGALEMPVRRGWLLGLPLPRALTPRSDAREYAEDGRFRFDVRLSTPFGGMIVRYRGWLTPDGAGEDQ